MAWRDFIEPDLMTKSRKNEKLHGDGVSFSPGISTLNNLKIKEEEK